MALISATPTTSAATSSSAVSSAVDTATIASNFTSFLQLLTTQLRNQNPLDPLDTNQFTQQLVQFAQVEQQMKQNEQLATLVAMEKTAMATTALAYVGSTVVVDGATTKLGTNGATCISGQSPTGAGRTYSPRRTISPICSDCCDGITSRATKILKLPTALLAADV